MEGFDSQLAGLLAALARCLAFAQAAPVFSESSVPRRVRAVLGLLLALPIASGRGGLDPLALLAVLPLEIAVGLLLGTAARLALAAAEMGGQLIGISLGLGFAGTFDPSAQEDSLPTRRLCHGLALLAFLSLDGLETCVRSLATPLIPASDLRSLCLQLVERGAQVLAGGVRLAAPLLLAGLVSNFALALASKAAPALNAFSVMLSLFLVVGGLVLFATAPVLCREILGIAKAAADAPLGLVTR